MYRMAMQCICQRGNMLHVKQKRTWTKNLGKKFETGRLRLSPWNQKERTSAKEPRRKNQNDQVLYSQEGKG